MWSFQKIGIESETTIINTMGPSSTILSKHMARRTPKPKTVLVDADGVLLDWEWAFHVWMKEHGFVEIPDSKFFYNMAIRYDVSDGLIKQMIRQFNESAAIGFLPALRDSAYYVKRLHEEMGYVFHCITSLSHDENAQKLRQMNLEKLFGPTVFERIVCLPTGAHKDHVLEDYEGTGLVWIEDKVENAEAGLKYGLRPLLMEHGHNMHYRNSEIAMVKNWKQVYSLLAD